MLALFNMVPSHYFPAYFIFFSALIVTIRTDLEFMLISRFVSLYLVPLGWLLSYFNLLPISPYESIVGSISGYLCLGIFGLIFYLVTKKQGLGQGDVELLAFIGSFIGIIGWWSSLMIGSLLGSILGIIYLLLTKKGFGLKIPFGPFLALGAILYTLFQSQLFSIIARSHMLPFS